MFGILFPLIILFSIYYLHWYTSIYQRSEKSTSTFSWYFCMAHSLVNQLPVKSLNHFIYFFYYLLLILTPPDFLTTKIRNATKPGEDIRNAIIQRITRLSSEGLSTLIVWYTERLLAILTAGKYRYDTDADWRLQGMTKKEEGRGEQCVLS